MEENHPSTSQKIDEYWNKAAFVMAVFEQLEREFNRVGVEWENDSKEMKTKEVFIQKMVRQLDRIMKSSPSRLGQLIYMVDLPEKSVDKIFATSSQPLEEIAKLMIYRVSEKVYYKWLFSKQ